MKEHFVPAWLLGAFLALSACTVNVPPASPYPPVPPLTVETVPNPPVSATPLTWQPGHWNWTGSGYVWEPGQYVPREGRGNMWMPGYWARTPGGGWAWQPAHWM
jgi:WXXGXW repeat (2 copies)